MDWTGLHVIHWTRFNVPWLCDPFLVTLQCRWQKGENAKTKSSKSSPHSIRMSHQTNNDALLASIFFLHCHDQQMVPGHTLLFCPFLVQYYTCSEHCDGKQRKKTLWCGEKSLLSSSSTFWIPFLYPHKGDHRRSGEKQSSWSSSTDPASDKTRTIWPHRSPLILVTTWPWSEVIFKTEEWEVEIRILKVFSSVISVKTVIME